jgi:predicted dinucleotide-binding enzyme
LAAIAQELGPNLHPSTVKEATRFADVLFLATPWRNPEALPGAELVVGKIVVDAMNPYKQDFSLYTLEEPSSVTTAKRLPGARLVKAFNTIWFKHLQEEPDTSKALEDRRVIPIAGNDVEAKKIVAALVEAIGFGPLDAGTLAVSVKQEPNQSLYNKSMTVREARAFV